MENLAVRLECMEVPIKDAIPLAASLGFRAIRFDALGELSPEQLSMTGRRHLRSMLQMHGLSVAAVGCPTRRGLDNPQRLDIRIEKLCRSLSFAHEMGASCVVHHLGNIPKDRTTPEGQLFCEVVRKVAAEGDRVGARLAITTGLDQPSDLAAFLAEMKLHGLAVNYDPANLLHRGANIYDGVFELHNDIVLTHLKDAVRTSASLSGVMETTIGEGDIDWPRLLGCFQQIGYHGWHIVDRESGDKRLEEIRKAAAYLRKL